MSESSRANNSPASLNRSYGAPAVVNQRARTLSLLQPQPGQHVLDVGCGSGFLSLELADAVGASGKVVALDHNPDMVTATRERCVDLQQVDVREGDVTKLSQPDNAFDAVTCTQVLLYVEAVERAVQEMVRVLRPGGRIAILETDWRSTVLDSEDQDTTGLILRAWDDAVPSPNLPVRLRQLMASADLESIEVEAIPILEPVYDPAGFSVTSLDWLSSVAVKAGLLDKQQASEWATDIHTRGRAGQYFFCVNRFLFVADKPR